MNSPWPWIIFIVFVMALLALDLGFFQHHPHAVGFREAAGWSAFWIALALAFNLGIYWRLGAESALQFFTSYLLETTLSIDNIFLFAMIFTTMGVAAQFQHRVLFWGVPGALLLRGAFILAGLQLVRHFHGVLYGFAVLVLIMGARLLLQRGRKYDPTHSRVIRLAGRLLPISEGYDGGRFFTRVDGRLSATPLFLVLIMIEVVDLTFALDSISAIFAVTQDAFIIFSSNVLAILGLRSFYFLLARALSHLPYLSPAVAVILIFIAAKMLLVPWVQIPTTLALVGILFILGIAISASVVTEGKT